MNSGRGLLAVVGATILGFAIADEIHLAVTASVDDGFVAVGTLAGFGLGLVLAAILRRSDQPAGDTGTVPPAASQSFEPWHDLLPPDNLSAGAGWRNDPLHADDHRRLRYWDGASWTGATQDR